MGVPGSPESPAAGRRTARRPVTRGMSCPTPLAVETRRCAGHDAHAPPTAGTNVKVPGLPWDFSARRRGGRARAAVTETRSASQFHPYLRNPEQMTSPLCHPAAETLPQKGVVKVKWDRAQRRPAGAPKCGLLWKRPRLAHIKHRPGQETLRGQGVLQPHRVTA